MKKKQKFPAKKRVRPSLIVGLGASEIRVETEKGRQRIPTKGWDPKAERTVLGKITESMVEVVK